MAAAAVQTSHKARLDWLASDLQRIHYLADGWPAGEVCDALALARDLAYKAWSEEYAHYQP